MAGNLVLLLASQRVGSTYFERSLQNMGGLGRPWEHFVRHLMEMRDETRPDVRRALFEECLSAGRIEDGTVGITIMANYFTILAKAYMGIPKTRHCDDVALWEEFWNQFRPRFDRVIAFHLTRDVVDQAVSQLFSEHTGVNHVFEPARTRAMEAGRADSVMKSIPSRAARMSHEEAAASVTSGHIINRIRILVRNNEKLEAFEKAVGLDALQVDYALSTDSPEIMAQRVFEHAGGAAASVNFASDTQKVIPNLLAERTKDQLASHLGLSPEMRAVPGALTQAAIRAAAPGLAERSAQRLLNIKFNIKRRLLRG